MNVFGRRNERSSVKLLPVFVVNPAAQRPQRQFVRRPQFTILERGLPLSIVDGWSGFGDGICSRRFGDVEVPVEVPVGQRHDGQA